MRRKPKFDSFFVTADLSDDDDEDDELNELRLRYQAVYQAYQTCMIELVLAGDKPSQRLVSRKAVALELLAAARHAYGTALAERFLAANNQMTDEGEVHHA